MSPMQPKNEQQFLSEDFGNSDEDRESGSEDESDKQKLMSLTKDKSKKIKDLPIEKLSLIYHFLM